MSHRTIWHLGLIPIDVKRPSAFHVDASRKMDKYLSQWAIFKLPKNEYENFINKNVCNVPKWKNGKAL